MSNMENPILSELLDRMFNDADIAGFSDNELTDIVSFLYTDYLSSVCSETLLVIDFTLSLSTVSLVKMCASDLTVGRAL